MRKLAVVLVALGMVCSFTSILTAQELQEGKWSGTRIRANGLPQPLALEVKRVPDPHTRWRVGTKEILTVTLQVGQTVAPLSDVRLDGENLSYAIPALEVRCSLMRQKDGGFAGKCAPLNAGGGFQMTMIPPKPTIPPK